MGRVLKIVLASSSPRRTQLLHQLGLNFVVDSGDDDEIIDIGIQDAHAFSQQISKIKALAVASRHPEALIIAADTIGILEGKILGKPRDADEARDMLAFISGKPHRVVTGYTVMHTQTNRTVTKSVETIVYIKFLTKIEIDDYVATGEPLDKAGSYGIQGRGAVIVEKIEGDYYNVVGLPLFSLASTLSEFGIFTLNPKQK